MDDELRVELRSRVQDTCQQLLDTGDESPYLLGFMVELLIQVQSKTHNFLPSHNPWRYYGDVCICLLNFDLFVHL